MIPLIVVVLQLSLVAINAPVPSCSSKGVLELGTAAFLLTRRPSLLQKRAVPEWVESAGQLKKGQVDIYFPQPLEETMTWLKKSAASKDRNN
jgi:hypothetical protein